MMVVMKNVEKKTVRRLGVWSVAKVGALFGIVFGLIAGIVISLTIASGIVIDQNMAVIGNWGYLSIILLPIVYGILYFIGGAITAWIYNLIAGWVGGIDIYFKK